VVKGICHRTKERLLADDDACEACDERPRCGRCRHYRATDEQLGVCGADPTAPLAYAALAASQCDDFAWGREG